MIIETRKFKGYSIELVSDENPDSPRNWDNLGVMFCAHGRYNLGDKQSSSREEIDKVQNKKGTLSLPVYLYDHSGLTMSTEPFSCQWDSGQVGIIYATREKILAEYGVKRVSKKIKVDMYRILQNEVKTYSDYLEGNVIGIIVRNPQGEEIDSCYGHYPEHDVKRGRHIYQYAIDEAESTIICDRAEQAKKLCAERANKAQTLTLLG